MINKLQNDTVLKNFNFKLVVVSKNNEDKLINDYRVSLVPALVNCKDGTKNSCIK